MQRVRTDHCETKDGLTKEFARLGWTGGSSKRVRIRRFHSSHDGARDGAMVSNTISMGRTTFRPQYELVTTEHKRKSISRRTLGKLPVKIGLAAAFVGAAIGSLIFIFGS